MRTFSTYESVVRIMTDPNRLQEPRPNKFLFTDPRWQLFNALQQGVKNANLVLAFPPVDARFNPFFIHVISEPNKYVFVEKPVVEEEVGRLYEADAEEDGFTLEVKAGIRDEDWDSGAVDTRAGEAHMRLQDELGLSVPNDTDLERFDRLVKSLASELLSRR